MEPLILDSSFNATHVIDTFHSFIWAERYREEGDFELVVPFYPGLLDLIQLDSYVGIAGSDRLMIVENIELGEDAETGRIMTVSGRSAESILRRRVIWGQTVITGKFQAGIQTLLNQNAIDPTDTRRKLPLTFKASQAPGITELDIDAQFYGEELYEAIFAQCEEKDLGFRVLPAQAGGFTFELYQGTDRSYEQSKNPYIVFSPAFDNIVSSNYLRSNKNLKTVAMVAGSGEGAARTIAEAAVEDGGSGLSRREMYTDASSLSKNTGDADAPISDADYVKQLKEKGMEELADNGTVTSFEGEVDAVHQFVYGRDFFIGDIVQLVNEHGIESRSRVTELVRSQDQNGSTVVPTFTGLD